MYILKEVVMCIIAHTSFLSFRLVTMTIVAVFCSQIIRQKSFTVSSLGPERSKQIPTLKGPVTRLTEAACLLNKL